MIIKKIFYCILDGILSNIRRMRRWYYRRFTNAEFLDNDLNPYYDADHNPNSNYYYYNHAHNHELTTYYVLASEENPNDSAQPIYPLSNSYIKNKFPFLYNSATKIHQNNGFNESSLENNQLECEEDAANSATVDGRDGEDGEDGEDGRDEIEVEVEDRKIAELLDNLKNKNEELLKYLPTSIPTYTSTIPTFS